MDRNHLSFILGICFFLFTQNGWTQDSFKNWQFSAGARYRFEDSSYSNLQDRKQFSHLRIRPLAIYDEGQGVKLVLEGQYVKIMGQSHLQLTESGTPQTIETSSNSGYAGDLDTLWMQQAYLDLRLREDLNLLLGRQSLQYGDQLIIGPSSWGPFGRSFDAVRLRWSQGKSWIDGLHSVLRENTINDSREEGDKALSALYVSHELNELIPTLDLYYFYLSDQTRSAVGPNNQHFGDYGLRVVTQMGDWSWKVEYAQNFGTEGTNFMGTGEDSQNQMMDTSLSLKQGQQQWVLQAFLAGKNWRELFPTTHAVLGKTDVLGRRNLTGAALHHKAKWSDLWSTDFSFYYFTRSHKGTAAFAPNSKTALGDVNEKSRDLGTEADLIVKYQLNPKTVVSASLSAFQYGEYFRNSANVDNDKTPLYSYIMVEAQF